MISNRQLFLNHIAKTNEAPIMLEIIGSEGIYLFDDKGKKYMDLISGIGVSVLGHRYPIVIDAIKNQLDKYLHTMVYGEFILSPQVKFAKLLTDILPDKMDNVYFVNSGSEAIEGAMKLAKRYTGRYEILSCKNAYHGSTHGAASLMSDPFHNDGYRPMLPEVKHIEFNNIEELELISGKTACIILEPIQAEAGVIIPSGDYMVALRKRCHETGTLLVFDEVQTGFGRTGKMFGFEHFGIEPDIIVLAKGIAGGMPLGVFVSSNEIMNTLSHNPALGHITTFGGHPVSAAAALATLETLLKENYIDEVDRKAQLFIDNISNPLIKSVRNKGLLLAFEVENNDIVIDIIKRAREKGVIMDWFLFDGNRFRIAPPLIITDKEILEACNIVNNVLMSVWREE